MDATNHEELVSLRSYAALHALLLERRAERVAHPGGSLLRHLIRTARRLERWGASEDLIAAGLYHAAYGTHGFAAPLFDLSQRESLRAALGERAEAVVYAYCALDRDHGCQGAEWRDRFSGEYWTPSERMRRDVAELGAANELDVLAHGHCTAAERTALQDAVRLLDAWLSRAAAAHVRAALQAPPPDCKRSDSDVAFRLLGTRGAHALLWHGGAGPELTWARQHRLASELQLCIPWRRGFAPSSDCLQHDWEIDARDLLRILTGPTHVIAHSIGGVSALVAASIAPERFASLTLIEPPLPFVAEADPAVRQLSQLARAFLAGDRSAREAFLRLADLPLDHPETARVERRARDIRDPGEAAPALTPLVAAGVRVAVVSGAHAPAIEVICDALASALAAERWVMPGKGHSVQRAPDFNGRWVHWLSQPRRSEPACP
jgi:pimeloyl-ACP methyl ester carboxylesterase